jgi:hypothetical protein
MHPLNRHFWKQTSLQYPRYFNDPSVVIELGAMNINGSIREYFNCKNYTGVDWRAGKGVDIVSLTHELKLPVACFDAVVSASMLEHDPYWKQSLFKMAELMRGDGIMVLSWGAALNNPHELAVAPDGRFHSLKAKEAFEYLESTGLYIHQFLYEHSVFLGHSPRTLAGWQAGFGEVTMICFKSPAYAQGFRIIDPFIEADR